MTKKQTCMAEDFRAGCYESPQTIVIGLDGEDPIMGASTETYNLREDYDGEWA